MYLIALLENCATDISGDIDTYDDDSPSFLPNYVLPI